MDAQSRLIVAIDRSSRDEILRLTDELRGAAGMFKIGLQAFTANGPAIVQELVAAGDRVFLDLKFHDIPNTAMHAVAEAARLGASIVNVHASGGAEMMRACAKAAGDRPGRPLVLAVTMLTSLDEAAIAAIGFGGSVADNVRSLARLARNAGMDGVVASPREIEIVRDACGSEFVILTPGIRAATDVASDQKRTLTAREAVRAGADYIVVGRPITDARDRRAAALAIVDDLSR
jgi:orotidine-5'-phosphate decarboxylase